MSFGTFNPNFYGITQSFSDPESLCSYKDYALEDDVAKWRDTQLDFDVDRLGALAANDHELRHFHDFLLSPWGIERMIWRLNASISGFFAIQNIRVMEGDFVPLPISRWMGWSDAQRETWLRTSGTEVTSLSDLVRLPETDFSKPITQHASLSAEDTNKMFPGAQESAARSYLRMKAMRVRQQSGLGFDFAVDDVFEASAHLAHATAIYHGQGGHEPYMQFMEFVMESDNKPVQALKIAYSVLQDSVPGIDARRTLEIFTWMLLGPFGKRQEHPDVRYGIILHLVRSHPEIFGYEIGGATADFWDVLDAALDASPWRENLRAAHERSKSRVDEIESLLLQLSEEFRAFPNSLLSVARLWERDVSRMVNAVINNPSQYCDVNNYHRNSIRTFPAPFMLIHYGKDTIQPPKDFRSWPHDELRPVFADRAKERMLYVVCSPEPRQVLRAVSDTFGMQRIIDYIFLEETTPRALDKFYFMHIEPLLGKKVLRVF